MENDFLSELISYRKLRGLFFRLGLEFEKNDYYEPYLNARWCKCSRIKKHFIYLITYRRYVYFLTFTFDNDTINKCDRTKRDLIKNCIKDFDSNSLYILNVDYGSQTEREHYHCLLGTDSPMNLKTFLELSYPCISKTKYCSLETDSISKLSKYINKLSNHAAKDSTRQKRVVYNFRGYDSYDKTIRKDLWEQFVFDRYNLGL